METNELISLANELTTPEVLPSTGDFPEKYKAFADQLYNEINSWGDYKLSQLQTDGNQRFSTSLPLLRVQSTTVALVGAGGLGNWIWRVLLGMGFVNVHVFDDDVVGVENIGPQGHNVIDLDLPKVEAVRRAALAFRGINLNVHQMRVRTFTEMVSVIGSVPDILIGATDSAEWRNQIIDDLYGNCSRPEVAPTSKPVLFIDLRMALGDWNAFITTPRKLVEMYLNGEFSNDRERIIADYRRKAVFHPEDAVQQPCTARAITYTGANVASYVGAFLHWWFTDGCERDSEWLVQHFYSPWRDYDNFNWLYMYSSRTFRTETITERQQQFIDDAGAVRRYRASVSHYFLSKWWWEGQYREFTRPGHLNMTTRTMYTCINDYSDECFGFYMMIPSFLAWEPEHRFNRFCSESERLIPAKLEINIDTLSAVFIFAAADEDKDTSGSMCDTSAAMLSTPDSQVLCSHTSSVYGSGLLCPSGNEVLSRTGKLCELTATLLALCNCRTEWNQWNYSNLTEASSNDDGESSLPIMKTLKEVFQQRDSFQGKLVNTILIQERGSDLWKILHLMLTPAGEPQIDDATRTQKNLYSIRIIVSEGIYMDDKAMLVYNLDRTSVAQNPKELLRELLRVMNLSRTSYLTSGFTFGNAACIHGSNLKFFGPYWADDGVQLMQTMTLSIVGRLSENMPETVTPEAEDEGVEVASNEPQFAGEYSDAGTLVTGELFKVDAVQDDGWFKVLHVNSATDKITALNVFTDEEVTIPMHMSGGVATPVRKGIQ